MLTNLIQKSILADSIEIPNNFSLIQNPLFPFRFSANENILNHFKKIPTCFDVNLSMIDSSNLINQTES